MTRSHSMDAMLALAGSETVASFAMDSVEAVLVMTSRSTTGRRTFRAQINCKPAELFEFGRAIVRRYSALAFADDEGVPR